MTRLAAIALLAAANLPAQPSADFEARYWIPQFRSTIRIERNGLGSDIDAQKDLGMSDTNFPEGRFTLHSAGHHRLSFTYTPIDFSADQVVSRTLVFSGRTYTFGTEVASDLTVQHVQFNWAYQFRLLEGLVKIGPMLEADGFLARGHLRTPMLSPPIDQKEDFGFGLPAPGIALEIAPHRRIAIHAEVAGLQVGSYGYFVGSDAGVRVAPAPHFFVTAGYRTFNLHVENSPDFARLQLRGPYVGAGFAF